jgi:hypothetical protein
MDDRKRGPTVTTFGREIPGGEKHLKYFVTGGRAALSLWLVWTGVALHG